jgi:CubicO group peptidase (beta-lactamase class C family)
LTHTGFWGLDAPSSKQVIADGLPQGDPKTAAANWGFRGATGVRSTVGDLYRWSTALDESTVLSEDGAKELFEPHAAIDDSRSYGYGWQLIRTARGTNAQVHLGADSGVGHFAALYRCIDEDVVVILLSNSTEGMATETLRGLLARIFPS